MNKARQASKSLRSDASAALDACAGWNSRLAARRISQFLERRMAASAMSLPQFWLMAQIASTPDDRLGALAERMGLDPSSLSRNLRVLERLGWIEIALVDQDQRRRMVWLTEAGAHALEAAMPVWRQAHEALGPALPPDFAGQLSGLAAALPDEDRAQSDVARQGAA
ncbi:MarR family winged helix-turn-helix transcriptional regulator [Phreatobacter stygius]|uniref:Winged helix-turn-helix transcriptional regulator n=1 Tax=Phreatobacter stygius TaxID=1940610 RepID=A0A4D7B0T0_9HYPH|nr:MarR family winged helix-turn-helix transcriptional regulator [Phreatobacter stygius]QCI63630.1 winged helix-turn-helix transcriptional regulator [Phreatobacter stygius]